MTPNEYRDFKGLKKENLRDHMDDIELILTMLGEATTTRFTKERDSRGYRRRKKDAIDGGEVAGSTRNNIENKLGKSVVFKNNFLDQEEKETRLEFKKKDNNT